MYAMHRVAAERPYQCGQGVQMPVFSEETFMHAGNRNREIHFG
jgi:hypothetical protein